MDHTLTRLENLREAYPQTPAEIAERIRREIAIQTEIAPRAEDSIHTRNALKPEVEIYTESPTRTRHFSWKKVVVLALVATMLLSTTVFASEIISRLRIQKEGKYAVNIGVTPTGTSSFTIPEEIPCLSLKANYVPEGYCPEEGLLNWNVYPEGTPYLGGITTHIYTLEEEITEKGYPLTIDYILSSEEITWQDRTSLYVEVQKPYWNAPRKRIYIPLPEYWQGLIVYAEDSTSKEDMLKYAENLEVIPLGGTYKSAQGLGWIERSDTPEPSDYNLTINPYRSGVTSDHLQSGLHHIGDTFPLSVRINNTYDANLSVCVKKVDVFDDFSPLEDRLLDSKYLTLLDENQKLAPDNIRYMNYGDGISTLSREIKTESIPQKLVYVTMEYTNDSDYDLKNISCGAAFCRLTEKDGKYNIYDRALYDGDPDTDYIMENELYRYSRTIYFDQNITDDSSTECEWTEYYTIPKLKAGETATVHIAGVFNEDELDKLYLSFGSEHEIIARALLVGYVDIRQ